MTAQPLRGELWWCEPPEIGRRPVGVLVERIGRLSDERIREICAALEIAVDCSR